MYIYEVIFILKIIYDTATIAYKSNGIINDVNLNKLYKQAIRNQKRFYDHSTVLMTQP
jgi:hypothetical protein